MAQTSNPGSKNRRRRYFVDPPVQGTLLRHAFQSWFWASAIFALISFTYRVVPAWLSDSGESVSIWHDLGPYLIASIVLLPIVMISALRFSNRFAGPIVRIRRTLKQLAQGEAPPAVKLRNGDFWTDIVADINRISERNAQLLASASDAVPEDQAEPQTRETAVT